MILRLFQILPKNQYTDIFTEHHIAYYCKTVFRLVDYMDLQKAYDSVVHSFVAKCT